MTDPKPSIVRRTSVPTSVSGPIATPLFSAVAYESTDADALDAQYEGGAAGFTYAREGHPNADVLTAKINMLEGAAAGLVTGSGMSALGAIYLGLLEAGDHVVAGNQLYGRNLRLLTTELPKFGITTSLVDMTDADALAEALRPSTKMIVAETVTNPTLRVADMEAIARISKDAGARLMVDNTFTTPEAYQPLAQGADLVMHSVTKLLAGHSDVTLGYVGARDPELIAAIDGAQVTWGMTAAPFDCWQAERGLHSFRLRFAQAQSTAAALADALAASGAVEKVLYPGRADHPDHARARALFGDQMGNMVSFRLKGGRAEANRFIHAAKPILFAPTLGDVATTLSHSASSSHRAMTPEAREAIGITEGFFRVSVGIEDPDVLIPEMTNALERLST